MSDQNILKEKERLRLLVEELKRDNHQMKQTIEMGAAFTEKLVAEYNQKIGYAQGRIEFLETQLRQQEHEHLSLPSLSPSEENDEWETN